LKALEKLKAKSAVRTAYYWPGASLAQGGRHNSYYYRARLRCATLRQKTSSPADRASARIRLVGSTPPEPACVQQTLGAAPGDCRQDRLGAVARRGAVSVSAARHQKCRRSHMKLAAQRRKSLSPFPLTSMGFFITQKYYSLSQG
jgi:hypothetical protein